MEIATETELKLAAPPEHLPALTRLLESRASGGPGRETRLVATYFDTQDGALARRGLTLRVREQEGRFVQTVKSGDGNGGDGAALVRAEWEDAVAGPSPDPHAPRTGCFVPAEAAGHLIPLVRTEITRRTVMLCPDPETHIEAAIDQGQIAAMRRNACEPVSEIELELKRGDVAALYDIALEAVAVAPVRLERHSKSARGFRLAELSAAPEHLAIARAEEVALDRNLTAGEALRRIARSCVTQIVRNEAAVLAGMPDGIHQMRVGVRRLRALLSAFAPLLPEDEYRWFSDELRWLGATLGAARNLDVFAGGLVAPATEAIADIPGIAALNEAVAERSAAAYADAAATIGSTRYTALVLRLLRWSEDRGGKEPSSPELALPVAEIARKILRRRLKVVRRRGAGFSKQSPDDRHRLRIALKKLRYAMEMLGSLFDAKKSGGLLQAVKRLQEELGDANDLHVSRDLVAELAQGGPNAAAITEAGAAMLDWHTKRLKRNERKVEKHVVKIRGCVPFW